MSERSFDCERRCLGCGIKDGARCLAEGALEAMEMGEDDATTIDGRWGEGARSRMSTACRMMMLTMLT